MLTASHTAVGGQTAVNNQRQVVAWVKELGGGVRNDYECHDEGEEIAVLKLPVPDPPCDDEHPDDIATVVRVDLPETEVGDILLLAKLMGRR